MRLILFDIDGTLVPGASSEIRFVRYLLRRRALGVSGVAAFLLFTLCFAPRFGRRVAQKNKAYLWRRTPDEMAGMAHAFVRDELLPVLHPEALKRLRGHCAAGDHVALISGTPQFIADALAEAVGADEAIGALAGVRGPRFAALKPPTRHPFGPTKIDCAHAVARRTGLSLVDAVAYGDSVHDRYLFHVVGQAVAVGPGSRLADMAAASNWETIADA